MLSDKGKQTVVCYQKTYDTLQEAHFSNVNHYKPVEVNYISGMDLDSMKVELTDKLNILANECGDLMT